MCRPRALSRTHACDAVPQTPAGSAFPLSAAQLTGANVWLMEYIAAAGEFAVSYDAVALPPALANAAVGSSAANNTELLAYVVGTLGYDCLVSGTQLTAQGARTRPGKPVTTGLTC